MFTQVELTEEELDFCIKQGVARHKDKPRVGRNTQDRETPGHILHAQGVIAEFLCQKVLGATLDWNIYGKKGDGARPDGILPDGRKLIIKSIDGPVRDVYVPLSCIKKAEKTDLIVGIQVKKVIDVLCGYRFVDTGFLGFMSIEEYMSKARLNPNTNDSCYLLPKTSLRPIEELQEPVIDSRDVLLQKIQSIQASLNDLEIFVRDMM